MTFGKLFIKMNPSVKVVENGTCIWLYFDNVNYYTFAKEWWDKEIQNNNEWISVKDGMPPEKETIFAKFKGTDQWNPAMFATSSEDVRVVVQFEDGTRKVWHDNTMDGKWKCERENVYPKRTVIYWMPNPELPKEEGGIKCG